MSLPSPLKALMDENQVHSLLWITAYPANLSKAADNGITITNITPDEVLQSSFNERKDMVFIAAPIKPKNEDDTLPLIAKSRDLLANRVLVECDVTADFKLGEQDFFALGFKQCAITETDGKRLQYYYYDLATYKTVPDWLNPRFWANPELWDKYRW